MNKEEIKLKLDKALAVENYEEAAKLRDLLDEIIKFNIIEIDDIEDTFECREKIIKSIDFYLLKYEEFPSDLAAKILSEIGTKETCLLVSRLSIEMSERLFKKEAEGKIVNEECCQIHQRAMALILKHCILLEIKHKHTKKESIRLDPNFMEKMILNLI